MVTGIYLTLISLTHGDGTSSPYLIHYSGIRWLGDDGKEEW